MRSFRKCLIFCMMLSPFVGATGQCMFDSDPTIGSLINFLQQRQSSTEDPCVDEALRRIADQTPRPALTDEQLQVVSRFLDHQRVLSEAEKEGIEIHFRTNGDLYPAIAVLFNAGAQSKKFLLRVLASQSGGVLRDNAAITWLLIYREHQDEGVRLIMSAALQAKSSEAANNLRGAAKQVARKCSSDERSKCAAALAEYTLD